MPYRRRSYGRRKRNYRRRPYRGRLATARKMTGNEPTSAVDRIARGVGTVATIARTVSGIVSMINVEDKYIDNTISGTATEASHFQIVLNGIEQGADRFQRNGNKVLNKCLQVNFRVYLDPASTAPSISRVVFLLDKKPQIGGITWNTVYIPNNSITGMIDKDTVGDRIVLLKDYKISLNPQDKRVTYIKFYCNLSRLHTQFTGPDAQDFESGALYMLFISDAVSLTPAVILSGYSRFCYMDN